MFTICSCSNTCSLRKIFPIKATHVVLFPKSHAMSSEEGEGATRFPIFKSRTAIPYSQCSDYSPDIEQFIDMPFFNDGVDGAFKEAVSIFLFVMCCNHVSIESNL